MVHNTELIYTGENFNAVFDTLDNAKSAFDVAKSILVSKLMDEEVANLSLDEDNNKIYLSDGNLGNENEFVNEICLSIANCLKGSSFYGHAFFADDYSAYESCADYEYENGVLKLTSIESPEGHGMCPECDAQIVCFDEYDPDTEYTCEECGTKIENHTDMFFGTLPIVRKYEKKVQ
jgi:hypothetical protein